MARNRDKGGLRGGNASPPATPSIDSHPRNVSEIFAPLIISLATELARQLARRPVGETPNCQCIPDPPTDGGPWIPVYDPASGWDYKNSSLLSDNNPPPPPPPPTAARRK